MCLDCWCEAIYSLVPTVRFLHTRPIKINQFRAESRALVNKRISLDEFRYSNNMASTVCQSKYISVEI